MIGKAPLSEDLMVGLFLQKTRSKRIYEILIKANICFITALALMQSINDRRVYHYNSAVLTTIFGAQIFCDEVLTEGRLAGSCVFGQVRDVPPLEKIFHI